MDTHDHNWRAEEACLNAWPAAQTHYHEGWLFRRSGGTTRRTNSANPGPAPRAETHALIDTAEDFYAAFGQRTIFRIPAMAGAIDRLLHERGYERIGGTHTLFAPSIPALADGAHLQEKPDAAWCRARRHFSGASGHDSRIYEGMLSRIASPCRFARVEKDGAIAAMAYGVLWNGMLVLESVATAPEWRRQGFAKIAVGTLMNWAREKGAQDACLQVLTDNAPAIALYRSLGFHRDLYGYHYRAAPRQ